MGKTNDEIREVFHQAGLKRPSWAYLEYYRSLFKDPVKMMDRINAEMTAWLESKLGYGVVNSLAVLDTVIMLGMHKLHGTKPDVDVKDLLQAVKLKEELSNTGSRRNKALDQLKKVLEGTNDAGKAEPVPSDRVHPDSKSDPDT